MLRTATSQCDSRDIPCPRIPHGSACPQGVYDLHAGGADNRQCAPYASHDQREAQRLIDDLVGEGEAGGELREGLKVLAETPFKGIRKER